MYVVHLQIKMWVNENLENDVLFLKSKAKTKSVCTSNRYNVESVATLQSKPKSPYVDFKYAGFFALYNCPFVMILCPYKDFCSYFINDVTFRILCAAILVLSKFVFRLIS